MEVTLSPYQADHRYVWRYPGEGWQIANDLTGVPQSVHGYCTIAQAISAAQKRGTVGQTLHQPCKRPDDEEYRQAILAALRWGVEEYGQVVPMLFRGVRTSRPDSKHLVLFGTPTRAVAEWYAAPNGCIREYPNVRALVYRSTLRSVLREGHWDDDGEGDIEAIFFPEDL